VISRATKSLRRFDRRVWLLLFAMLAFRFGHGLYFPFSSIYFHNVLGIPLSLVGVGFAVFAGASVLSRLVAGPLTDRYGRKPVMLVALAGSSASFFAFSLVGGFAGYLVEALCDAALTMAFWVLVRPVHRNLAMLMVVFRIISTCGFAASEVLYFSALPTLRGASSTAGLQPDQVDALAYILLRIAGFGGSLFSTFYGFANIVFGWLIYRSGYIPRVFGVGMILTGIAFAVRTFLLILAPAYASWLLLATAAVAFVPLILWLLVKGVNEEAWARRASGT